MKSDFTRRKQFKVRGRIKHRLIVAGSVFVFLGFLIATAEKARTASFDAVASVPDTASLKQAPTGTSPFGLWRLDYARGTGAPPLYFVPQAGTCANNGMTDDGGGCVDTTVGDGNSWKAVFPTGRFDIREFGAKSDNHTPADGAVAATIAYASARKGCAYVPSMAPGFTFERPISSASAGRGNVSTFCLVGDRIQNTPLSAAEGSLPANVHGTPMLHFPNDSDGIIADGHAVNGFYIADLSLIGNAVLSKKSDHTHGLFLNGTYDGVVQNVYIQNFVVCRQYTGPSGRVSFQNIFCFDKYEYPNIVNDYPYAAFEMDASPRGAVAALQDSGGEMAAQSHDTDTAYKADGSVRDFQMCAGLSAGAKQVVSGLGTVSCAEVPKVPSAFLWAADGIRVRTGSGTTEANGQHLNDGQLKVCGYKGQKASYDYDIYDISAGGGRGEGGRHLFCTMTPATLTKGSDLIVVPSTAGYHSGIDILISAPFGVPLATKVVSVADDTHLVMSKAATESGRATLTLAQIAVATSGDPGYATTCQATLTCGHKIEIRFVSAPAKGTPIQLQWVDPTGYAAVDAEGVSDYLYLQPTFVGGYRVGLKHVGLSYGGIEFRPTYIEILNQCASVESQTYGDVLEFHQIINDPVPDCPGYIDPRAGPTIAAFNNVFHYYNGASNGEAVDGAALSGSSGAIGGRRLRPGQCLSGLAAVGGAAPNMTVVVSPNAYPGDGAWWQGYVSSPGEVTVKVCARVEMTPTTSAYNVRVFR